MLCSTLRGIPDLRTKYANWIQCWVVGGITGVSCVSHPVSVSGQAGNKSVENNDGPTQALPSSSPSGHRVSQTSERSDSLGDSDLTNQSSNEVLPKSGQGEKAPSMKYESCRSDKLTFSLETSCNNDGSVEVCIPSHDQSQKKLEALVSDLRCGSWRGRAVCNPTKQRNCLIPIDRSKCIGNRLSAKDWQRVCTVANLEFVEKVVPTFLE